VEDFAAENVVYLEIRTTPKVLLFVFSFAYFVQFSKQYSNIVTGFSVFSFAHISSRTMKQKG
jgi:hypothetical protein